MDHPSSQQQNMIPSQALVIIEVIFLRTTVVKDTLKSESSGGWLDEMQDREDHLGWKRSHRGPRSLSGHWSLDWHASLALADGWSRPQAAHVATRHWQMKEDWSCNSDCSSAIGQVCSY